MQKLSVDEILAHISAPTTQHHDELYRAQAASYFNFKAHRRISLAVPLSRLAGSSTKHVSRQASQPHIPARSAPTTAHASRQSPSEGLTTINTAHARSSAELGLFERDGSDHGVDITSGGALEQLSKIEIQWQSSRPRASRARATITKNRIMEAESEFIEDTQDAYSKIESQLFPELDQTFDGESQSRFVSSQRSRLSAGRNDDSQTGKRHDDKQSSRQGIPIYLSTKIGREVLESSDPQDLDYNPSLSKPFRMQRDRPRMPAVLGPYTEHAAREKPTTSVQSRLDPTGSIEDDHYLVQSSQKSTRSNTEADPAHHSEDARPPISPSDKVHQILETEIVSKETQPASRPNNTQPAVMKRPSNSTQEVTKFDFASLPIRVMSPLPPTAEEDAANWPVKDTDHLKAIMSGSHKVYLDDIYRPLYPNPDTNLGRRGLRGYWSFETSEWSLESQYEFWKQMANHIRLRRGSDMRMRRGRREPDTEEVPSHELGNLDIWCWAELAEHTYRTMYVFSGGIIKRTGAKWYTGPKNILAIEVVPR